VRGLVSAVSQIEKLETGLTTLLGSANLAKETLSDLQSFAANTPFQLPGIASAANKLLAFGFAQDGLIDRLKTLGDVAAGSNSDLESVALIYGQVGAAGKLTGERLLQFQERAIPIGAAIAKSLGVAESQVKDLVSSGKVGFKEFETAFNSLTESGGQFNGALQAQSKTVGGVLSTLSDNFFNLEVQLGKTFGPAIVSSANELITILQNFSKAVAANGPILTKTFSKIAEVLLITPSKFWLDFFAGDANANLAEVEKNLAKANEQLQIAKNKLANSEGTFLGDLLGGTKQAKQDILEFNLQVVELSRLRDQLTKTTGASTEAEKKAAAAKLASKNALEAQLALEKKQLDLRTGLGNIGLTREQQIQNQAKSDLDALKVAREAEAITEDDFNARRLERERLLQEQLSGLRTTSNQKIIDGLNAQETAQVNSESTIGQSLSNLSLGFKAHAAAVKTNSIKIGSAISNGIGNSAANAFSAFGKALVTGENALKAFGKALLSSFGQAIAQQGQGFILQGVAQSLAGFGSGAGLIAAGGAMVVFGSALSAKAGGAGGGSVSQGVGAGGGVASDQGSFNNENPATAQVQEREEPSTQVAVNINGDVFDSEETGTRISQILSDSFQQQGIVISNGSFA